MCFRVVQGHTSDANLLALARREKRPVSGERLGITHTSRVVPRLRFSTRSLECGVGEPFILIDPFYHSDRFSLVNEA